MLEATERGSDAGFKHAGYGLVQEVPFISFALPRLSLLQLVLAHRTGQRLRTILNTDRWGSKDRSEAAVIESCDHYAYEDAIVMKMVMMLSHIPGKHFVAAQQEGLINKRWWLSLGSKAMGLTTLGFSNPDLAQDNPMIYKQQLKIARETADAGGRVGVFGTGNRLGALAPLSIGALAIAGPDGTILPYITTPTTGDISSRWSEHLEEKQRYLALVARHPNIIVNLLAPITLPQNLNGKKRKQLLKEQEQWRSQGRAELMAYANAQ